MKRMGMPQYQVDKNNVGDNCYYYYFLVNSDVAQLFKKMY